ncbi:MAG: hypothetical protein U0521_28605 [Anaerolineae bacterium]
MPRKGQKLASTLCAKPGCTESRHVYPGGGVSPYCKAHNGRRRMKQRDGQEPMSGRMMDILEYLLERKAQGELLAELRYPQAQAKSIRLLVHQQRIFRDERLEGVRYGITEAGEAALAPFAQYVNRRDGICPHCGVRPRHVRSSGHKDGWCLECQREQGREERALGIQYVDITRPCSRCGVKPLYQFPGGAYSSYCKDCTRIVRRENARKLRRERFLEYQATGKLPTCKKCKVKPVRAFPNCLSRITAPIVTGRHITGGCSTESSRQYCRRSRPRRGGSSCTRRPCRTSWW